MLLPNEYQISSCEHFPFIQTQNQRPVVIEPIINFEILNVRQIVQLIKLDNIQFRKDFDTLNFSNLNIKSYNLEEVSMFVFSKMSTESQLPTGTQHCKHQTYRRTDHHGSSEAASVVPASVVRSANSPFSVSGKSAQTGSRQSYSSNGSLLLSSLFNFLSAFQVYKFSSLQALR